LERAFRQRAAKPPGPDLLLPRKADPGPALPPMSRVPDHGKRGFKSGSIYSQRSISSRCQVIEGIFHKLAKAYKKVTSMGYFPIMII
jgi:hypothetical protein